MLPENNFSAKLKNAKEERGATFVEFAEEMGISKSALQEYLKGNTNPRLDTIKLLAEKLGMPVSELIGGTDGFLCVSENGERQEIHPSLRPLVEDLERQIRRLSDTLFELDRFSGGDEKQTEQ